MASSKKLHWRQRITVEGVIVVLYRLHQADAEMDVAPFQLVEQAWTYSFDELVRCSKDGASLDHFVCTGTGIGKMLDTFQPACVLTNTWFIRNLACCGGWPAAPIVNMIGT